MTDWNEPTGVVSTATCEATCGARNAHDPDAVVSVSTEDTQVPDSAAPGSEIYPGPVRERPEPLDRLRIRG